MQKQLAVAKPVTLPPSIAATKSLRCADNSVVFVDFYSDGSVLLVPTPGHSPGHQSFLLNLPRTGPILLAIDAVVTMDHWHDRALPGLTTSMSDALRSVERLKAIVERTSAKLVPGHDPESWRTILRAPAFYG